MRSAVSAILSAPAPDTSMSHPDYEQTAHDHAAILVLVKHIGTQLKPKAFSRVYERISRQNHVKLTDSNGVSRDVMARCIKEYPVENNDWGDYQTHRRLLGLITVGKFDSQAELNELCRIHESLKVKYSSTLFDSRSVLLGQRTPPDAGQEEGPLYTTPSNFKAQPLFYYDAESCPELESQISEFLSALFWVLESKRLERSREKVDRVSLLLAPFERKDFVGLDLESRTNRKRCVGRMTKHLGDLCLQSGLANDALGYYVNASEILKTVNDWLWLGGCFEGMCAASVVMLYPNLSRIIPLQRNSSLQEGSPGKQRANSITAGPLPAAAPGLDPTSPEALNILAPDEIPKRYREAIIHYSKYQNAGVIETEACFKAAQIAVEQGCALQASTFLQNVLLINLTLTETEKLQRFISLSDVYTQIGFHRKSAFCKRLAAMRYVSPQNQQPNWTQCYQLMLQALSGHKLGLDPTEYPKDGLQGWPCLQVQLLQELVVAAKRMGHSALATRHMTFLLQTLWHHLSATEQRDMAVQLQSLAAQCEGAPVPLVLDSGAVIPPANLTNLPQVRGFKLKNSMPHLRPQKIVKAKEDIGPFLFTPINFGSLDRKAQGVTHKIDYLWVEGDLCEVAIELANPLPFELKVANVRLLTTGSVFESMPASLSLPPGTTQPQSLILTGIPKEIGELEVQGYSTHVLGVKSNCRLKHMGQLAHPHFLIDVIPALPRMQVSTSLPKSVSFSSLGDPAHVVTSASITLFAGESAECSVTLLNDSSQPIEMLDVSVSSALDRQTQAQVFQWSQDNLQAQLPIAPGAQATFTLYLFAAADFLDNGGTDNDGSSLAYGSPPGSLFSGPSSLPSRLSSASGRDSGRRNDMSSSFRAGSSCSGSSGWSRFPLGRLVMPQDSKLLEGQLKLRYSGGPGLDAGYCRQCSVAIVIDMLPSVVITHWDVLPAETSEQFYLVLDAANATQHELELHYAPGKLILMEAEESCRVPVPVDRCSLTQLANLYGVGPVSAGERGEADAVCARHIAQTVDLRWNTSLGDTCGKISLAGITLSAEMLDVVRMSPLQWEVTLDSRPVRLQEETSCRSGQCLRLGVTVRNFLARRLTCVALDVRFYQDHQNGVSNYRLETRLASSGASKVLLPELAEQGSAYHECNVVFFTPGLYKVDIQCSSQEAAASHSVQTHGGSTNPGPTSLDCNLGHTWKFNPPLAISVVD